MNARDDRDQAGTRRESQEAHRAAADSDAERRRRRARFLRELAEARELRQRVAPQRSRVERFRQVVRMRSFRT
jgi:hypothetical protein